MRETVTGLQGALQPGHPCLLPPLWRSPTMQTCAHTARLSVLCLGVHRVAGARLSSAAAIGATAFTGSTSVLR